MTEPETPSTPDPQKPDARLTRAESNRRNAQKSTGPKDVTSTRYNAVKHGLRSEGITELDNPESFPALCAKLEAEYRPVGDVEAFLVRRIALMLVRLKRAVLLEAEYVTAQLNPPVTKKEGGLHDSFGDMLGKTVVLDPGLPARLSADAVDALCNKYQRYECAIENKLYRAMHQLERLQRMRRGEMLPAPAAVDVALRGD
jgi:hypothetical protein